MEATKSRRNGTGGRKQDHPIWVMEGWQTAYLRVKGLMAAEYLWNRVLTPDDRRRLGDDFEASYRDGGAAGMWMRLRGVSPVRAVIDVGIAMNLVDPNVGASLLRYFGEVPANPAEALSHAVAKGGLVIQEFPRKAWWQGEEITIDWSKQNRSWALLTELARQSKAGLAVDRLILDEDSINDQGYIRKLVSRLSRLKGFPATLKATIARKEMETYRFEINRDRIHIFVRGAGEMLQEWLPGHSRVLPSL